MKDKQRRFKKWTGGRAQSDRRSVFSKLRTVGDESTRNLLRGVLSATQGNLLSAFLTNRVRRQVSGEYLAQSADFLFGKLGAFPFSNQGSTFRSLLVPHQLTEISSEDELNFLIGHLNGWEDDVCLAIDSMMSLSSLANADPVDALNAIRIFSERWGASTTWRKRQRSSWR